MTPIEIEQKAQDVKATLVRIGSEFREKRPDHEFTKMIGIAEVSMYELTEYVQKLRIENEELKQSIERMDSLTDEYESSDEKVEVKASVSIDDEDWLRQPLRSNEADF